MGRQRGHSEEHWVLRLSTHSSAQRCQKISLLGPVRPELNFESRELYQRTQKISADNYFAGFLDLSDYIEIPRLQLFFLLIDAMCYGLYVVTLFYDVRSWGLYFLVLNREVQASQPDLTRRRSAHGKSSRILRSTMKMRRWCTASRSGCSKRLATFSSSKAKLYQGEIKTIYR